MESDEKEFLHSNIIHRYYVNFFLSKIVQEIFLRAHLHDVSKYSDNEFPGFKGAIYYVRGPWGRENIPNIVKEKLRSSIEEHHKVNDHHPEFHPAGMEDMDLIQLLEMAVDWRAAMIRHGNHDIDENIQIGKERFGYPDFFAKILANTLKKIQKYELEADLHLPNLDLK